jgi:hypothetical protein
LWIGLAAVLAAGAIALGLYLMDRNGGPDGGGTVFVPPTHEECRELLALKNRAVGYLENIDGLQPEQLAAGEALWAKLAERLPNEPLVTRDLAIWHTLVFLKNEAKANAMQGITAEAALASFEAARARAVAAIARAQEVEPQSAVPYVLSARVAQWSKIVRSSDLMALAALDREAVGHLVQATSCAPDDAALWYELYETARNSFDPEIQAQARPAKAQATELAPDNLRLVLDALVAQAEAQDPQILETIERLRPALAPLDEMLRQPNRLNQPLAEFLDGAAAAAAAGNWDAMVPAAGMLNNVLVGEEMVKSDLRQLRLDGGKSNGLHPLTWILHDFSAGVCDPASFADDEQPGAFQVKLVPVPAEATLPALPAVTGLCLVDYDLDGWCDVLALGADRLHVVRRDNPASAWQTSLELDVPAGLERLLAADLDADVALAPKSRTRWVGTAPAAGATGDAPMLAVEAPYYDSDADLVLYGPGGVMLLRNELDAESERREFVPVPQDEAFAAQRGVTAAVLADVDHDGDLDLVASAEGGFRVWAARGSDLMTFEDFSARSALPPAELRATSLVAVDWERDRDIDILVAGSSPAGPVVGILENQRHGQLRWREFDGKLAELAGATSLQVVESDGNVSWDIAAVGPDGLQLATTLTPQPGTVTPVALTATPEVTGTHSVTWDLDNDTFVDLVSWGDGIALAAGRGRDGFAAIDPAAVWVDVPDDPQAVGVADLDGDGDGDLVVAEPEGLTYLDNDGGNRNGWIDLYFRSESKTTAEGQGGPHNSWAIGCLAELKIGPLYRAQTIAGQVTHFGLGDRPRADAVRIIWTNGVPQVGLEPERQQRYGYMRVFGSSCPYLYAWNGEQFAFCTDACWASPLGLQLGEGNVAAPRPWEYLLIRGDQLQPRDGEYLIQYTEELMEATYLDRVQLLAIDHPADVQVYSNEKVGPEEIAQFKVHTVRQPRVPVAARDSQGRDVFDTVAHEDGIFWRGFQRCYTQGLVDEHYLELDLGDLRAELAAAGRDSAAGGSGEEPPSNSPPRIMLYLTGWLAPTTTSINVSLTHNPGYPARRPPAIWVPDADGEWRETIPFMGFPGGKTKTIAVDLTDAFLTDDYRVRIATTLELYWDAAFFTVNEPEAELRIERLDPTRADLHYRGFSAVHQGEHNGPHRYDYEDVSTSLAWPPMRGCFTRFGDVRDLLLAEDDRQVVFGQGDEITLAFAALPDPPPGWTRDYLIYSFGWDKDMDLNTIWGQDVEPLPFAAMRGYPFQAGESFPDTPELRAYLDEYQTRRQDPNEFWRVLWTFDER